ncbi:hypothetical protein NE237_021309 [Protea cynaroides]|uniref:Glycerol-3-phosphate dehydrogenase [NAD(+)] n=1 Tax=Protea cynaroides TaxID=273540 RepID=A0A9Q0K2H2_9MAGN|nr:hypothetical protein NE237_021309 [Protea cynaroides]
MDIQQNQKLQGKENIPSNSTHEEMRKYKVAIIGSGNWGSVAAKLIASNTIKMSYFHDEVRMWVFEETLPTGEKLSDVINLTKENVKYLPGIKLGKNVVAYPDLDHAVEDADMLVFVTPHQFMEGICNRLAGKIKAGAEAISLVKGMEVKMEGPNMISTVISRRLGINCCVLMGANIANEIALEKLSEATVGYRENKDVAERWAQLFTTTYFLVTAAAIMRIGLIEMRTFSKLLFPSVKDSTFFESCGVADLITTCLGGRNRKVAEAFARNGGKRSFDELETELLNGQKLQLGRLREGSTVDRVNKPSPLVIAIIEKAVLERATEWPALIVGRDKTSKGDKGSWDGSTEGGWIKEMATE